jgi:hypothetical protein
VLDPDLDKYRRMDPRAFVNAAVDTIAGGVPDNIRADYLASYDGDRFGAPRMTVASIETTSSARRRNSRRRLALTSRTATTSRPPRAARARPKTSSASCLRTPKRARPRASSSLGRILKRG